MENKAQGLYGGRAEGAAPGIRSFIAGLAACVQPVSARRIALAFTLVAFFAAGSVLEAATRTWTSTSSQAWGTSGNWSGGTPGSSDIALFNGINPSGNQVGFNGKNGGSITVGAISLSSTSGNITIGNSANNGAGGAGFIILDGATVNSVANTILSNATTSPSTLTIQDTAAGGTFTTNVQLGGTANVIQVTTGNSIVISCVITEVTAGSNITLQGGGTLTLTAANTYTGVTTISSGTLSTNLLANGGTASGLGSSGTANTNLILNGGVLQYTGAAVSTNRLFSTGTAGGTIDASGAGALNLTGTGAMGFAGQTGARTLTLTGTNTGANTLAMSIRDDTGATALLKSGSGTWVLSGSNSYTGLTTIQGGTLQLSTTTASNIAGSTKIVVGDTASHSSAILDVTTVTNAGGFHVVSGQTLSGYGTVKAGTGKTVTVDSGAHWATGGSVGSNAVTGNLTLLGVDDVELGTPGASHASPGTGDQTSVSGTLTLGGNLNLIDNAGANGQGSAGAGSYKIFTQSGAAVGSFASVTDPGSGLHAKVDTGTGGSVFVDVYRLATTGTLPSLVNLGNVHLSGTFGTSALSIQNTASGDGFSEGLNASGGSLTGAASTSGSITNLGGGLTGMNVLVGLGGSANTSTAGAKTGTVLISLASNGSISTHGNTSLTGQTVTVTGFVYSGQGIWNTNGGGNWSDSAKWQTDGGVPGLDAGFVNTDSATFGTVVGSGTAMINLNGASPSLAGVVFNNAGGSYLVAQNSGSSPLRLNNGAGAATITGSNGTHAISAPVELDSDLLVTVVNSADTLTLSGSVSQSGGARSLVKTGSGTLQMTGVSTYTGTTSVQAGTLVVSGSLSGTTGISTAKFATLFFSGAANSSALVSVSGTLGAQGVLGTINAASGGRITLARHDSTATGSLSAGGLTLQSGATLAMRIGSTTAGTGYDQITVTGGVSLAGDLEGSLLNGFTPAHATFSAGHVNLDGSVFYLVIGATGVTGGFSNVQTGNVYTGNYGTITINNQQFAVSYTANAGLGLFDTTVQGGAGHDIAIMALPEPDVIGSIVLGSAFLIGVRRRRLR